MSDSSQSYHDPMEALRAETMEVHRALVSLQEELEAVDWYRQRSDACRNEDLRAILIHNMREEIEHASMLLEWLRCNNADFGEKMHTYLFVKEEIVEAEERAETQAETTPDAAEETPEKTVATEARTPMRLTIGSLKEAK